MKTSKRLFTLLFTLVSLELGSYNFAQMVPLAFVADEKKTIWNNEDCFIADRVVRDGKSSCARACCLCQQKYRPQQAPLDIVSLDLLGQKANYKLYRTVYV